MKTLHMFLLAFMCCLLCTNTACNDDDPDQDGILGVLDLEPNTPLEFKSIVDAHGKAIIKNVFFLMDNTSSMDGFKVKDSEFKKFTYALAVELADKNLVGKIKYQTDSSRMTINSLKEFEAILQSKSKKDSDIGIHFKDFCNNVNDTTLSIYVTDAQIDISTKDKSISNNADAAVKISVGITSALTPIFNDPKSKSAIIIKMSSKFDGNYDKSSGATNNQSRSIKINGIRPYYIFVVGPTTLINFFINNSLQVVYNKEEYKKYIQDVSVIHYDLDSPLAASVTNEDNFIDKEKTKPTSAWAFADNNLTYFDDDLPIQVNIGLDLSVLMRLQPSKVFMASDFSIDGVTVLECKTKQVFLNKYPNISEPNKYDNSTVVLKVQIDNPQKLKNINIYYTRNYWDKNTYSIDEDFDITNVANQGNTYKMNQIIDGFFTADKTNKDHQKLKISSFSITKF